jgi:hypothetical protein
MRYDCSMTRGGAVAALSPFTAEQWGMVTATQARAAGVSRVDIARLVADGVLEAVAARVYRLTGAPPEPDLDGVRTVWLQLGDERPASSRLRPPDAIVAGRSAALMLGMGDLRPLAHEFYVTRRRQLRRDDVRLRVLATMPGRDWRVVQGLPVSRVSRVVADLLAEHEDGSAIARICQDAVAASLLDAAQLTEVIAPFSRTYGAPSADAFVAELLSLDLGRDSTQAHS